MPKLISSDNDSSQEKTFTEEQINVKRRAVYNEEIYINSKTFQKKLKQFARKLNIKSAIQADIIRNVLLSGRTKMTTFGKEHCITDARWDSKKTMAKDFGCDNEKQIHAAEKELRKKGLLATTGKAGATYREYAVSPAVIYFMTGATISYRGGVNIGGRVNLPHQVGYIYPLGGVKTPLHSTRVVHDSNLINEPTGSLVIAPLLKSENEDKVMNLKEGLDELKNKKSEAERRQAEVDEDTATELQKEIGKDLGVDPKAVLRRRNELFKEYRSYFMSGKQQFDFKAIYSFWDKCIEDGMVDRAKAFLESYHGLGKPTASEKADSLRMGSAKYCDYLRNQFEEPKVEEKVQVEEKVKVELTEQEKEEARARFKKLREVFKTNGADA